MLKYARGFYQACGLASEVSCRARHAGIRIQPRCAPVSSMKSAAKPAVIGCRQEALEGGHREWARPQRLAAPSNRRDRMTDLTTRNRTDRSKPTQ